MQYQWLRVDTQQEWETLTKQVVNYPATYPVLAGCVQVSDTDYVVIPLAVVDIPGLLASHPTVAAAKQAAEDDVAAHADAYAPSLFSQLKDAGQHLANPEAQLAALDSLADQAAAKDTDGNA